MLHKSGALVLLLALVACGAPPGPKYIVDSSGEKRTLAEAQNIVVERYLRTQVSPPTDKPLKALTIVLPPYPERLQEANIEGTVRVRFRVSEDGSTVDASVVGKALPILAAITVNSVLQWRFEPVTRGGVPVSLPLVYEFVFRLE